MYKYFLGLILCILMTNSANTAIFSNDLQKMKRENISMYKTYLYGVGEGIYWTNSRLREFNRDQLFCLPGSLPLTQDLFVSMYEAEYERFTRSNKGTAFVETIMLDSFIRTFPCDSK